MNERQLRLWLAAEAMGLGRGGIAAVTEATGVRRKRIGAGLRELEQMPLESEQQPPDNQRVRRAGAGRKQLADMDPSLLKDLESLIAPATRGDPESPLRWTTKSARKLTEELKAMGHDIGRQKVCELLHDLGYSLQGLKKTREGEDHPDRDAQFRLINRKVREFQAKGQPVISVDTKKKELIGDFHNKGREWQPKKKPQSVRTHDFIDRALGKAIPYGVYDVTRNEGWVNVGIDHDTAEFAVQSIRRWWYRIGRHAYPGATELFITADAGGSNGYRARLWKYELDKLARDTGLRIVVAHYPPGTSKWNKIEHRMFSFISLNWRGRPLLSVQTVVSLIASTETRTGLKIKAALDKRGYETAVKVSKEDFEKIILRPSRFHGEWNYGIG
jgi:hypothetical protein